MAPQKGEEVADEAFPDRVSACFEGKTILITGGTGFMGKVLVERLLRKCNTNKIVLAIRHKKGNDPQERLKIMFSNPLFDKVTALRGGVDALCEKIKVVNADMLAPDLDMSEEDRVYIQDNVDIIIHAAATVRFDELLRKAILLNVRGTKLVIELAKTCKNLKIYVHISTAYCHLEEKLLEEKPYPPPADPHGVIATAELFDDQTMESIRHKFLKNIPNSYAYTKALGEGLAVEAMEKGLPLLLVRPSIVIPIIWDPVPGWTDNINGPTGLLIGAGRGVIRTMYCRPDSYADYLPVDVFTSGVMVAIWNYISYGDTKHKVFNFTSSAEVKVTWSEMIDIGRNIIMNKVPLNGVAWYPGGSMKYNKLHHNICVVLFHWIPAILVDALLVLLRYEPVLIRVQKRIAKGFEVFEYYTCNQWDFKSDVGRMVRERLNPREKIDYKVDARGANIEKYFEDCVRAARLYIMKDGEDSIPAAKRHMKVMWFVDMVVRILFWAWVAWMVYKFLF